MVVWLYGSMVVWLYGCMVVWLYGCMVIWLYGYMDFLLFLRMEKKYLTLLDVEPYNVAYELSNRIWDIVLKWNYFAKDTIGKQFVRAVDSVSANIAEGFGRYHKKDKMKFYRYAKGSLYECVDWCKKAKARQLLSDEEFVIIQNSLQSLPKQLNTLIKYTYETLKE